MDKTAKTNKTNKLAKKDYIKSQEIIGSHLHGITVCEIGNPVAETNNFFTSVYMGGVISSEKEGVLSICACLKKREKFKYGENDSIDIVYPAGGTLYLFSAQIVNIRESAEKDYVKINALFKDRLPNLEKLLGPLKFVIIDSCVLTGPVPHQRRKYPRSSVKWDVYFKLIHTNAELEKAQNDWISKNLFECERGYFKTQTTDVSAGGFKSIVKANIPDGTVIECIIEIKIGDFKAISRITSKIIGCSPNTLTQGLFDMRVKFMDLSESMQSAMASGKLTT